MAESGAFRIGELSRRSGVSPELLRAWERRYGLLDPSRSKGGLRLYSPDDLERVRAMQRHLDAGMAAAEAASHALREEPVGPGAPRTDPDLARRDLGAALAAFDEARAQTIIDELLAATTVDTLLSDVVLPLLHDLGERWERGEATVAQEHFASSVLRGRMLGLARGWGRGLGPIALVACLPDEQHDLGALAFALVPLETVEEAAARLEPSAIVLSGVSGERVVAVAEELRALGARWRLALGGKAAVAAASAGLDLLALPGDPVDEADRISAEIAAAVA
jgi:DNA-binding transcriptional MerR regulator